MNTSPWRGDSGSRQTIAWLSAPTCDEGAEVCATVAREFPRSVFFLGKLIFEHERFFQRLLHNETAYQLQRRLQFAGLNAMVLPVRVLEDGEALQQVAA